MIAEEKAKELVGNFEKFSAYGLQKQCALIAVDEILKELEWWHRRYKADNVIEYWNEVKTEINNL